MQEKRNDKLQFNICVRSRTIFSLLVFAFRPRPLLWCETKHTKLKWKRRKLSHVLRLFQTKRKKSNIFFFGLFGRLKTNILLLLQAVFNFDIYKLIQVCCFFAFVHSLQNAFMLAKGRKSISFQQRDNFSSFLMFRAKNWNKKWRRTNLCCFNCGTFDFNLSHMVLRHSLLNCFAEFFLSFRTWNIETTNRNKKNRRTWRRNEEKSKWTKKLFVEQTKIISSCSESILFNFIEAITHYISWTNECVHVRSTCFITFNVCHHWLNWCLTTVTKNQRKAKRNWFECVDKWNFDHKWQSFVSFNFFLCFFRFDWTSVQTKTELWYRMSTENVWTMNMNPSWFINQQKMTQRTNIFPRKINYLSTDVRLISIHFKMLAYTGP